MSSFLHSLKIFRRNPLRGAQAAARSLSSDALTIQSKMRVALVGRPNVGKSTLFNRLTRKRNAIVSSIPGTTRDRMEGIADFAGFEVQLIDTGGLDDRGSVNGDVQKQVECAVKSADVIVFLLDSKSGVTALDMHFAQWLRRRLGGSAAVSARTSDTPATRFEYGSSIESGKKRLLLVANKTEGAHLSDRVLDTVADAARLGLGDPILISASHGEGITDLSEALIRVASEKGFTESSESSAAERKGSDPIRLEDRVIQLAVMGKPNVGKSTIINTVLREDRLITGPIPGLTRDSISVTWKYGDRTFLLVDTAGLTRVIPDGRLLGPEGNKREKRSVRAMDSLGSTKSLQSASDSSATSSKSSRSLSGQVSPIKLPGVQFMDPNTDPSQFSVQVSELALASALNALRYAQVILLVVESTQGRFSHTDLQLARKCLYEGRALVIAANKMDLVRERGVSPKEYEEGVRAHCVSFIREFGDVPIVPLSAKENEGINRLMKTIIQTHDSWSRRIDTWVLNRWMKDLMVSTPAPRAHGRALKVKYITQIKCRPPTFALFCNVSELPGFFMRFLRSRLQHDMSLKGVPLRFVIRKTRNERKDSKTASLAGDKENSLRSRRRIIQASGSRPVGPKRKDPKALRAFKVDRELRRRTRSKLRKMRFSA